MTVPINTGGVTGTATLTFGTPMADLDRPRPRMGLTLPFANSQFANHRSRSPTTLSPLGGTIVIVDVIEVIAQGTNQIVDDGFQQLAPRPLPCTSTVRLAGLLQPALAAAGLTLAQAQNAWSPDRLRNCRPRRPGRSDAARSRSSTTPIRRRSSTST